jgi:polyhydroxyalkanoic acid synthase PhaR subunit
MAESTPRMPNPADFLTAWQQAATQSEQQWNEFFNQTMGTDAFASLMGRYLEGYLNLQKNLAQSVEKYLQAMNLPTRSDVTALGERLAAIESQLSTLVAEQRKLEQRVATLADAGTRRKGGREE